jgi:hypothetical protein
MALRSSGREERWWLVVAREKYRELAARLMLPPLDAPTKLGAPTNFGMH